MTQVTKTMAKTVSVAALMVGFTGAAQAVPLIPTFVLGAGGSFAVEDGDTNGFDIQDESDGYKGFVGIESTFGVPGIQPSLGVELQYSDLGKFELNNNGGTHEADTIGLSAIAGLQLLELLRVGAKGGVHFWDSDFGPIKRDGTDFFFGLSTEIKAAPFASIRFEWEHFYFDDDNIGFDSDLDVGSVSFVLRAF